jgi:hypothetical protein
MPHYYVHKNLSLVPIFRQSTPRLFLQDAAAAAADDDDDDHIVVIIIIIIIFFIIQSTPRSSNCTFALLHLKF